MSMLPRPPKTAQDGPRQPQDGPRASQDSPRGPQDGPKRGPRGVPRGSQIGLPRPSNIEAQKGSAPANLKCGFGLFLGPSWGPYRPYIGPLGVIFGLLLSILTRITRKSKNEGPPTRNPHFWGSRRALEGPCWGYVGVKLASSGHLNISSHHLSDEGRYKGGRVTFWGGSKRTPRLPVAQNPVFLVGAQRTPRRPIPQNPVILVEGEKTQETSHRAGG